MDTLTRKALKWMLQDSDEHQPRAKKAHGEAVARKPEGVKMLSTIPLHHDQLHMYSLIVF